MILGDNYAHHPIAATKLRHFGIDLGIDFVKSLRQGKRQRELLQEIGNIEIVAEGAVFRLRHIINHGDGTGSRD